MRCTAAGFSAAAGPEALLPDGTTAGCAERNEQPEEPDAQKRYPKPDGETTVHELKGIDDTGDGQHHDDQADRLPKESLAHKLP